MRTTIAIASLALVLHILPALRLAATKPESMRDPRPISRPTRLLVGESMNPEVSGKPLSLLDNTFVPAITTELKPRGYEEVAAGATADLLVAFDTARADTVKCRPFSVGVGVGSWGGSGAVGSVPAARASRRQEGTLVVHAIARHAKLKCGRARDARFGKGNVEPAVVRGAVADVFRDFPSEAPSRN